ncbi:MAG TPA: glycosyltransferase [Thermoanaerobaculia bacterium]|nr:glycosyltransferase [Thermoanaerobaculia bacterium]
MSEAKKTRLLFVIGHLVQSGAERYAYELCKAIDRDRFEVAVLTKSRIQASDYYYGKLLDLGIPVHRRLPVTLNRLQRHARKFYLAFRPLIELGHRWYSRLLLGRLLEEFDVINCIQLENYLLLQPVLRDNSRVITHLMSNAFQYGFNPYMDCASGRQYRFVFTDPTQIADFADAPCAGAEATFMPLALDLSATHDLSSHAKEGEPYDIGVFMRLGPERPISGLFRAFAKLVRTREARLRIWGRGDPAQFDAELHSLGIRNRVIFEGHTNSIESTLRDAGLSLVWMTCVGTTVGYATTEVSSFGFPMLFWNLADIPDQQVAAETGGAIRSFRVAEDLAGATEELMASREGQLKAGRRLRRYILDTYEIAPHVRRLEEYMLAVAHE